MSKSWFSKLREWNALAWASFWQLLGAVRADRRLLAFVLILLALDLSWILYFGVSRTIYELGHGSTLYRQELLLITKDLSIPEWLAYSKLLLAMVLLVWLARLTRQPIYLSWALILALVALDDGLTIHETAGRFFARLLDVRPPWGLRPGDVGEVVIWSILGMLLVPLYLVGLARSSREHRTVWLVVPPVNSCGGTLRR